MGFSSSAPSGGDAVDKVAQDTSPGKQSFGENLLNYMKSKYPVAGGLANIAFGHNDQAQPAPMASAPLPEMPDYGQMISMNAQPKQSGGLSTIIKLLAG